MRVLWLHIRKRPAKRKKSYEPSFFGNEDILQTTGERSNFIFENTGTGSDVIIVNLFLENVGFN